MASKNTKNPNGEPSSKVCVCIQMHVYKYIRPHDDFQTFAIPGQPFVASEPAVYLQKPFEVAKITDAEQT